MIKLVALDLDGTIVNEELQISIPTITMLQRIRDEKGIKVILATGRMFPSTLPFARKLGITDPIISYQGAMIRDIAAVLDDILLHPMLWHQTIPMEMARTIIDFIQSNGLHANVYVNDQLFTTQFNPQSAYYQKISGVKPQAIADLHQALLGGEPSKIMIIDNNAREIMLNLHQKYSSTLNVCRSRADFCEIVHASVSKWNAIQQLMKQWDIKPEEVMAIGDEENDLPMIIGAGIGVAMGNAAEAVKAVANYITESIEADGAAKAIEKFVYGHLPLQDTEATLTSYK